MHTIDAVVPVTPALALTRDEEKHYVVHALGLEGPEAVGTFASARDAWAAIDVLDLDAAA